MTADEIRTAVLRILGELAPEADLGRLRPDEELRESLDLDSMDFLAFVTALDHELHVAVPEADYAALATLEGCVGYLASRLGSSAAPAARK